MKLLKILSMMAWVFLLLYLPNKIGMDKDITIYLAIFLIAFAGVLIIQYLFNKASSRNNLN